VRVADDPLERGVSKLVSWAFIAGLPIAALITPPLLLGLRSLVAYLSDGVVVELGRLGDFALSTHWIVVLSILPSLAFAWVLLFAKNMRARLLVTFLLFHLWLVLMIATPVSVGLTLWRAVKLLSVGE